MRRPPLATLAIALACLLGYRLELAAGVESTCLAYGFDPAHPTLAGALVSLFLHASWSHLLGNVVVLVAAGSLVEREVGSLRFALIYLAAGLAGAALHVAVDANTLVGNSGALCGLLAVVGAIRPRLLGFAAGFVGWNVWLAWSGTTDNVSFAAHLGGFSVGALFVLVARARGGVLEAA